MELKTKTMFFDAKVRDSFLDLKATSQQVFDSMEGSLFKVGELAKTKASLPTLLYRYYGSLEKLDAIKKLNPDIKWSAFDASIKALKD